MSAKYANGVFVIDAYSRSTLPKSLSYSTSNHAMVGANIDGQSSPEYAFHHKRLETDNEKGKDCFDIVTEHYDDVGISL